ncbi:PPOX class F420-dependent oxidoreductase [Nocardia panacis]|uniref:PPOX class F420-dependent oxidoreductase n=1 Tax=Nocardia panacis TaxID=2340916 RepID=A0A3A4L0J0_9NOCA|nr:PPOX class F420-dependent oxidoreductase [Nocardia panacis]RJO75287.1 PPOX class F420-dependent oxidoreductase [Nocardia panacis]
MTTTAVLSDKLKKYIDDEKVFASIATIGPDGLPHVKVIWVVREGDDLIYSTLASRQQGRNLARDPRATVLITHAEDPYLFAEIRGTVTLSPDPERKLPEELSLKYTGQSYAELRPDSVGETDRVIVRITPQKVLGEF